LPREARITLRFAVYPFLLQRMPQHLDRRKLATHRMAPLYTRTAQFR
jgi:hypothetical protein